MNYKVKENGLDIYEGSKSLCDLLVLLLSRFYPDFKYTTEKIPITYTKKVECALDFESVVYNTSQFYLNKEAGYFELYVANLKNYPELREEIKAMGFRWSKIAKVWGFKWNEIEVDFAFKKRVFTLMKKISDKTGKDPVALEEEQLTPAQKQFLEEHKEYE